MNPEVDAFIQNAGTWQEELEALRSIVLDSSLTEEFKWRAPCYTVQGRNVVMLGGFKEYCVLSFIKGVLLKDTQGILGIPGANSQSVRVIRFTSAKEVTEMEPVLKAYIREAIEVERAGLKVDFKEKNELVYPEELQKKFDDDHDFQAAFQALTPGRQRAYILYIAGARQSSTRAARIEKHRQRILEGKGINDCVCGKTNRPPTCDGTHKHI